jgi:hypothetical protein
MGFLGVYRALYDYAPQSEEELAVSEGDLLFVLERGEDDWWRAKKKAPSEDEPEPEGLIPSNYVEEVSICTFSGHPHSLLLCLKTSPVTTLHHPS